MVNNALNVFILSHFLVFSFFSLFVFYCYQRGVLFALFVDRVDHLGFSPIEVVDEPGRFRAPLIQYRQPAVCRQRHDVLQNVRVSLTLNYFD
jgi:hypothetical protein